jgi:hypothetical protein
MAKSTKLPDPTAVSAAELGEIVGIDRETVNNWLRRGIITRASVGGRLLRTRLFSADQVYKAALTKELVGLGLAPSAASLAVKDVWKEWQRLDLREGGNFYAVIFPNEPKSSVIFWWQKRSGGVLSQLSSGSDAVGFNIPRQSFAVIPISDVVAEVGKRLARLPADAKANARQ